MLFSVSVYFCQGVVDVWSIQRSFRSNSKEETSSNGDVYVGISKPEADTGRETAGLDCLTTTLFS